MTFSAPADEGVEAHVPLLRRATSVQFATGRSVPLTDAQLMVSARDIGGSLVLGGLRITVPDSASIRWPALQHNPYRKDGSSSISDAKLVLVLPFEGASTYTVTLSHQPTQ